MPFLDWVNKNQAVSAASDVPYHLLQLQTQYGDAERAKDNLLIQGDNLQALKALLPFYTGKVKCIFIDPPYNTGSAFEHYDDKLEHSQWLTMMYPRLVLLRELLADDGFIVIQIDDAEVHYLKTLCDEIYGRSNFINEVCIKMSHMSGVKMSHVEKKLPKLKEYLLIYAKSKEQSLLKPVFIDVEWDKSFDRYNQFIENINDDVEDWRSIPLKVAAKNAGVDVSNSEEYIEFIFKNISSIFRTARNASFGDLPKNNKFTPVITKTGINKVLHKGEELLILSSKFNQANGEIKPKIPLGDIWLDIDINNLHNEGGIEFKNGKKPEILIKRVIELCTSKNDLILDSFLGSGATAAVAHKMNRRYIGIEMGEHAQTHCIPRLEKVITGEQGGISKAVNWASGGGFSFYTLGEAVFDAEGHISQAVRFNALAAYIWLLETKTAMINKTNGNIETEAATTPYLGTHEGIAYYLLYNGVLGDRRPDGGNVLTSSVLAYLNSLHRHNGKKIVFGEASRLGAAKLALENISSKQIPYELHESIG